MSTNFISPKSESRVWGDKVYIASSSPNSKKLNLGRCYIRRRNIMGVTIILIFSDGIYDKILFFLDVV